MRTASVDVIRCFSEGLRLILRSEFRLFILAPIALNILIFILLSAATLNYAQALFGDLETQLPYWLVWLKWLLWPLLALVVLIVYGYSFNLITTIIAAPFLGFLSEKIENHTRGIQLPEESLIQLIPRTFKREFIKLGYFVPRSIGIGVLILTLMLLPGANILGALLGGVWGSWCLALQFCDYSADNHQLPFSQVRAQLSQQKISSLTFGGIVLAGSMTPLINIFITPLAVAAGTLYWIRRGG